MRDRVRRLGVLVIAAALRLVGCDEAAPAGSDLVDGGAPDGESVRDADVLTDGGEEALAPDAGADADAAADSPIAVENRLPGTSDWILANPATQREIEGYASKTSVSAGESLAIFVNTAAPAYTLAVYRLGWYGGLGARLVAPAVTRTGHIQIVPAPDADGLVECDWTDPHAIAVPPTWLSGLYVAKLTASGSGKQSYVPFVVREDARVSTYLFQSSVTTAQAYNNWGGLSLYDFNSGGGVRASRVSFLRPYALGLNPEAAAGVGAGEWITNLQGSLQSAATGWEYPMVRFMEREGYDVSYATNVDVDRDPDRVARHRAFLSVGHDEYWSAKMRDHVESARDHGGTSLGFFTGNESYWQIRLEPSKSGAPDATVACFKGAGASTADPFRTTSDAHRTTVLFRDALLARSEEGLGGVAFQDFGMNTNVVVHDPSSWVFAGTGATKGTVLAGLLGYEVDGASEPPLPGVRRVMRSPWSTANGDGVSDAVTRTFPSGAESFAVGSIQFTWGLDDFRPPGVTQPVLTSVIAQQLTRNVLARLAAIKPPPSNAPLLLEEPFNAIAPETWSPRVLNEGEAAFDPGVGVVAANGRLTITPKASVSGLHHGGLVTARTHAMTCGVATVTLVQATSPASEADTTFAVVRDEAHWYRMTVEGSVLVFGVANGARSQTTTAYDAVLHRRLRIRHDCVTDEIKFETSPDGVAWTVRRTVPRQLDLGSAYVELEAGTYKAEAAPGQAVFDDLTLSVTGVRETFDGQRQPETFRPDAVHEGGYDRRLEVFTLGGALHLRPSGGLAGLHHAGWATTRAFDWRGGIVRTTLVAVPNAATEASVSLAVVPKVGGWVRTTVSAGSIVFQSKAAGVVTGTSLTFDPVAHKVVRIRHDATPDEVVWETSPDGSAWTERRRVARPFALDSVGAEVEAGTYQAEAADPGEAIVDDFLLAR